MKRTTSGLCLAAAFAFAASLGAQTTTTTSGDEISVTGCLARGATGGFVLNNAHAGSDMNHSTAAAGTTGTSGTTAGTTTGSATGTTSGASGTTYGSMNAAGSTWKLEGDSSELEKHVGHMVQVTGKEGDHGSMSGSSTTTTASGSTTTSSATGTTGAAGTSGTASRNLDVKSVKMISSSCS